MLGDGFLRKLIFLIPSLLVALTIHEYAHGWMASRLGDDTAKRMGRLSFNPLVHLDLLGTLCLLLTGLAGWAKPVPINPSRFRNRTTGMILVSLAGPLANLALMFLFVLAIKCLIAFQSPIIGLLGGSARLLQPVVDFLLAAGVLNLGLAAFNLIPIPPLDGYQVVSGLLPDSVNAFCRRFQIVFFIALLFAISRGYFSRMIDFLLQRVFSPLIS